MSKYKIGKSLKTKLLLITLPVTVAIILSLLFMCYKTTSNLTTDSSKQIIKLRTEQETEKVEGQIGKILLALDTVGDSIEENGFTNEYVNSLLGKYGLDLGIYIYTADGQYFDSSGYIMEDDPKTRSWYKEAQNHKNGFELGEVYKDAATNTLIVTASRMLKDNTIVCADIELNDLSDEVSNAEILDGGKGILIDESNNTILAAENKDDIGKSIDEINLSFIDDALNLGEVTNIGEYTCFSKNVHNTSWILISYTETASLLVTVNKFMMLMIFLAVICVCGIGGLQLILLNRVTKPIEGVTDALDKMASGDLTIEVTSRSNDELGVMSHTLRKYADNMKNRVADLLNTSVNLKDKSNEGNKLSMVLKDESSTQAQAMNELKETMEQISKSVTDVADDTVKLASSMEEGTELSKEISSKMSVTMKASEESKGDMIKLENAVNEISQSMVNLEDIVKIVVEANGEMKGIIDLIKGISEQTNLLSLNASIESARAGEAGKGFAVVSNEIGQLADRSAIAVEDITRLIEKINGYLIDTSAATRNSVKCVEISKEVTSKALDTFEKILEDVEYSGKYTKEIESKIVECSNIATGIAAITEEQSASVEEVLATVETLTESAGVIGDRSKALMEDSKGTFEISEELNSFIREFKIN